MMSQQQGQKAAISLAEAKDGAPRDASNNAPPAQKEMTTAPVTKGESVPPARALNTDPNYKQKEAGTFDEQKDKREMNFDKDESAAMDRALEDQKKSSDDDKSDEKKDDEDKTMWESFKEGAVEFENRVASALKPLEERVNNATTTVTDAVKETGEEMDKSVREYDASEEAKKEAEKEQKAQKEQTAN